MLILLLKEQQPLQIISQTFSHIMQADYKIIMKLMFPQIGKQKKKLPFGTEQMKKQWQEITKELDFKYKYAVKKIPTDIIGDFNKVSKIKQLPQFYVQYFVHSIHKASNTYIQKHFKQEIEKLMTNKSHYHTIINAIKARHDILIQINQSLSIVEGFENMNTGKNLSHQIKGKINDLLKDCVSLDQVKQVQNIQIKFLANSLDSLRLNSKLIYQHVKNWRKELQNMEGADVPSIKKMKIIFPQDGINCLFICLQDSEFLKKSFLKKDMTFSSKFDPFLENLVKNKRQNNFQKIFLQELNKNKSTYQGILQKINDQIPVKIQDKSKQIKQEKQEKKAAKQKSKEKVKNQSNILNKSKSLYNVSKTMKVKKNAKKKNNDASQDSLQKIKQSLFEQQNSKKPKSMKQKRGNKRIIIEQLSIQQQDDSIEKQSVNIKKHNKRQFSLPYNKKKSKQSKNLIIEADQSIQSIKLQKVSLMKQLSNLQKQRKKLENLLKKTEDHYEKDNNRLHNKLENSRQQISILKQQLKNKKNQSPKHYNNNESPIKKSIHSLDLKESKLVNENQQLQEKYIQEREEKNNLKVQIKQLHRQKERIEQLLFKIQKKQQKKEYKKTHKHGQTQDIANKNKSLEVQLKESNIERIKLEKVLKQSEKQVLSENQKLQKKLVMYQDQINLLKGKINQRKQIHRPSHSLINNRQLKQSNISIVYQYKQNKAKGSIPEMNLLQSHITAEKQEKRYMERQIKQLNKEKTKIQKLLEKTQGKISKEKQVYEKKIEKYEELISKLKNETAAQKNVEASQKVKNLFKPDKLRMYTTTPIDDQKQKFNQQDRSMNLFHPSKKKNNKSSSKYDQQPIFQEQQFVKHKFSKKDKSIQIVKTKKTIEIIFDSARKVKKSIITQNSNFNQQQIKKTHREIKEKELKINQVQREKKMLEKKLNLNEVHKDIDYKNMERKVNQSENQISKFKQLYTKEKGKKLQTEDKIRKIKYAIKEQYESKIDRERQKFKRQKEQLMKIIQKQKEENQLKEKHLTQQVKFLKEMEKNENQLIQLLESQKKQKKNKEKMLIQEINKREQVLALMQIQQIKKGIEQEVRQQLNNYQQSTQENFDTKKNQLEYQIKNIRIEGDQQLQEIQKQNQKLKELIDRIKAEEGKLLTAIKANIEEQNSQESVDFTEQKQYLSRLKQIKQSKIVKNNEKSKQSRVTVKDIDNQQVMKQLKQKTDKLIQLEQSKVDQYHQISQSLQYKERQRVQNLVQFYLQNPHTYPNQQNNMSQTKKDNLVKELMEKNRRASQFQQELMKNQKLRSFVPTISDDPILSHLLNLRQAYENHQIQSLRRSLFPPLNQQQKYYQDDSMSVQSKQRDPPVTINDHVLDHARKYKQMKVSHIKGKNFLVINKMRVMLLEETRKQKQRSMIEQESKIKVKKKQLFKRKPQDIPEKDTNNDTEKQIYNDSKISKKSKKSSKKDKRQQAHFSDNQQFSDDNQFLNIDLEQKQIKSDTQKQQKKKVKPIQQIEQEQQDQKQSDEQQEYEEDYEKQDQIQQKKAIQQKQDEKQQYKQLTQNDLLELNQHNLQKQKIQKERQILQEDILSYQDSIRSYISGEQRYQVYQQFIKQQQFKNYIKETYELASEQIKQLNNNPNLFNQLIQCHSIIILIAKDKNNLETGVGIFHKNYHSSQDQYVCDYLLAHNMKNFLNLVFNFSRYFFINDQHTNSIHFLFQLQHVNDQATLKSFVEFQQKCKRLGEVYVNVNSLLTRKYVLRRNLFEQIEYVFQTEGKGLRFDMKVQIHEDILKQKGEGFKNKIDLSYVSANVLLAYYLKQNQQKLKSFRERTEEDISHRELLLTSILFDKKQIQLKNTIIRKLTEEDKYNVLDSLDINFNILNTEGNINQIHFQLQHEASSKLKRCTFTIEDENINYNIIYPDEAITRIQTSNSSQSGIFLNLIPKYKILIIEAEQFLTMSKNNPSLNVFFYVRHFIKNIVQVQKQSYTKIFLPEIFENEWLYFQDTSEKMKQSVFFKSDVRIGWNTNISNSIVYTPHHKDLVIQKPFIISLLSANIERIVEGTPICAKLII